MSDNTTKPVAPVSPLGVFTVKPVYLHELPPEQRKQMAKNGELTEVQAEWVRHHERETR